MIEHHLQLEELSLYVKQKSGNSPAIIFIHGNSSSSQIWQKQLDSEELSNYQLIAFDLPGHGKSSHSSDPDKDYNPLGYVAVLKKLLNSMQLKSYILVGFSLGGHIAIQALLEIQGCKGVLVTGTPPSDTAATLFQAFLPNPALYNFYKDVTEEEVKQVTRAMLRKDAEEVPSFLKEDFIKTDKNARIYLQIGVAEGKYRNEIDSIRQSTVPVAIVSGVEEQIIDNDYLKNLSVPLWRKSVQFISQAGHLPPYENPALFNKLLLNFINDVS